MLSNPEAQVLTALMAHARGTIPLSPDTLATLLARADAVLQSHMDTMAKMSSSAQQRHARNATLGPRKQGKPASTWFRVSLGMLWEQHVLGAAAVHELVTDTVREHDPRGNKPPTAASMQVQLSRTGSWWRLLETELNGTHVLEVARMAAPPQAAADTKQPIAPETDREPRRERKGGAKRHG